MAKTRKKCLADAVHARKLVNKVNPFAITKPATSKHLNPFEVHVNKEKFHILGRTCKHDKGLPGISRSKASKKRKESLGQELLEKFKSNQFKDRRICKHIIEERDSVFNARFVADKIEGLRHKQSRFNLNDDEILTHCGQTLEEVEHFRDERSDDEIEIDDALNGEFTEAAHFSGDFNSVKDRKAVIEEMIMEQKKRKMEVAKDKDEVFNLTEKLDTNYKNLTSFINKIIKSDAKENAQDDYDKLTRELIFEPRGVVSDKLKTEQELIHKNQEHLKKLKEQQMERMRCDNEGDKSENILHLKHRSADDLDDSYYNRGNTEDDETLVYTLRGELNNKSIAQQIQYEVYEPNRRENSNEDIDSSTDEEDEDDLSDLKEAESDIDEINIIPIIKSISSSAKTENKSSIAKQLPEIPFVMLMPNSYTEFQSLLNMHKLTDQTIVIQSLLNYCQASLESNKSDSAVQLFEFLLQLLNDNFSSARSEGVRQEFQFLSTLMPILFDLVQIDPERMCEKLLGMINENYKGFRRNPKQYPSLETLIIFKLVSNLCSTSDFRHPLVTPCYIYMQHILSTAKICTCQDIARGLFLVTLCLEYSTLSKRIVPAVYNFILGVISLAVPKRLVETIKISRPFPQYGANSEILIIPEDSNYVRDIPEQKMICEDLVIETNTNDFKVRCLSQCLQLVHDAATNISEHVGTNSLAEPFLDMFSRLSINMYPCYIKSSYEKTKATLEAWASKSLLKLQTPKNMPKVLRLLEPRIEPVYDDKRRPKLSKDKEERVKLLHKVKRETKGAIREIRRDTEFLQKIRIKQQLQSDRERQEKVKRIFVEAAQQQSELKALVRDKKKRQS